MHTNPPDYTHAAKDKGWSHESVDLHADAAFSPLQLLITMVVTNNKEYPRLGPPEKWIQVIPREKRGQRYMNLNDGRMYPARLCDFRTEIFLLTVLPG
jgi:hypothetical protein